MEIAVAMSVPPDKQQMLNLDLNEEIDMNIVVSHFNSTIDGFILSQIVPEETTSSTWSPERYAIEPTTENTTKPARKLVPQLMHGMIRASLKKQTSSISE